MPRQIVTSEIRTRLLALAREGLGNKEIAAALQVNGLTPAYVAAVITKARRDGAIIPYRLSGYARRREARDAALTTIEVVLDTKSMNYLRSVGDVRGIAPEYLAGVLIEAVARDNLADAVLDDGVRTS